MEIITRSIATAGRSSAIASRPITSPRVSTFMRRVRKNTWAVENVEQSSHVGLIVFKQRRGIKICVTLTFTVIVSVQFNTV